MPSWKSKTGLGDLERVILARLWETSTHGGPPFGGVTVRELHDLLEGEPDLAYTTVMTVLDRLERKGLVTRERDGRAWRYSPVTTREALNSDTMRRTLGDMHVTDRRTALLHFLNAATTDEIEDLTAALAQFEGDDGIEGLTEALATVAPDPTILAELDALPAGMVVDVLDALGAAAAFMAAQTGGAEVESRDAMFFFSPAAASVLAGHWDVLHNEAESRLSRTTNVGVARSRELIDKTWDPAWRVAMGYWRKANEALFADKERWGSALESASNLSTTEYFSALTEAGEEATYAIEAGILPCSAELASERPDLARHVMRLWRVLSPHSPRFIGYHRGPSLPFTTVEPTPIVAGTSGVLRPTSKVPSTPGPMPAQSKGAVLEEGLFEVLAHVFDLEEQTTGLSPASLRRQLAGTQFGTDLVIRTRAARSSSTCLLECKNYRAPIKLSDVSDKLLAAEAFFESEPVDYWILISPHTDPSNELDLQIQKWNAQRRFPFQIEIWSPQTGLPRLLALAPSAFKQIYGPNEPVPAVTPASVVADFTSRLRPWLRLPVSVAEYLKSTTSLLQPNEREWLPMLNNHIQRGGLDAEGRILTAPLTDVLTEALQPADPAPTALLTADFGEGKSFFTVVFCHGLRDQFLKDPSTAKPIPFRFYLKDFRKIDNASNYLQAQLDRIGLSRADWAVVTQGWNVVVVLDGMDEMSVPQDVGTIRHNLGKLSDLLGELNGIPVLVTTRPNFFGSERDRERFYDRLRQPEVFQLKQPDRSETVAHLREFAMANDLQGKLDRIKELYDPIGLAGKVLFLEMIKATLPDLPEDRFNERVLYETYIRMSFVRKVELLRDPEDELTDAELYATLMELLEQVAVAIHTAGEGVVDLKKFLHQSGGAANLLWKAAERADVEGPLDQDAATRVGGRSLLRRLRRQSQEECAAEEREWLVDFFHRSMKEYFVARAIVRALNSEDAFASTRSLLRDVALQPEIVNFFTHMVGELTNPAPILSSLAHSARVNSASGTLGGAAATLFKAVGGDFKDQAWTDLNLDGALLVRADLAGGDFRRSTMRGVSLASADLTGADLRACDLSDANLGMGDVIIDVHEAAPGTFLALTSGSSIARVQVNRHGSLSVEDVRDTLELHRPERLMVLAEDMVVCVGSAEVVFAQFHGDGLSELARFKKSNAFRDLDLYDGCLLGVTISDEYGGVRASLVDLDDGEVRWSLTLPVEPRECRWCPHGVMSVSRAGLVFTPVAGPGVVIESSDVTSVCVDKSLPCSPTDPPAAFFGTGAGKVGSTLMVEAAQGLDLPSGVSSPVNSLAAHASTVLATSEDGSISLWEADKSAVRQIGTSERRLRCMGALVSGMGGPREHELFVANGALDGL